MPDHVDPPVNVLRLALHPDGMAPRIVNLAQWRGHLLTQLQRRGGYPRQSAASSPNRMSSVHSPLAQL